MPGERETTEGEGGTCLCYTLFPSPISISVACVCKKHYCVAGISFSSRIRSSSSSRRSKRSGSSASPL